MRLRVFVMGLHMNAMLGKGVRVLIVDDDEDVRQFISDRLPFRRRGDRLQYAVSQRIRFPKAVPARLARDAGHHDVGGAGEGERTRSGPWRFWMA